MRSGSKNIRANPTVTLRFRQETLRHAIHDAFCGSTRPFDYAENLFHRKGVPSRTKILELHTAWLEGGVSVIVDVDH